MALIAAGLATADPSLAADPIKLGAALSISGRFSDSAKYVQEGYQLWAETVNAKGGIGGRPVEIVTYDDESNPETGRVLAERLIDRDGVLMILGPYSSPITDAMATATERAQVPLLGTIASDSSIWQRRKLRWTFQTFPSAEFDHEPFLKILEAQGGLKKMAIIFEETPFSIAAKEWSLAKGKQIGLSVDTYGYNPGAQDFRSILERVASFGPDAVLMAGYYQPGIAFTRQMIERGLNPAAYYLNQAADGVTKDALGANVEGIFGRSPWEASSDDAESKEFTAAYKAKFGRTPSYHSAAGYAAAELAALAIQAKGTDRAAMRDFFATGTGQTLLGKYHVNERGQQDGYRYIEIQWQGGEPKIVGGDSKNPVLWPKPAWK